jgi:hypothetical protein
MNRDATHAFPQSDLQSKSPRQTAWGRWACCLLGVVFLTGCSCFNSQTTAREKETIYSSPNQEKPGWFSPRSGPKTTKQFLGQDMVRLPPQS